MAIRGPSVFDTISTRGLGGGGDGGRVIGSLF